MKKYRDYRSLGLLILTLTFTSCASTSKLSKNNILYQWKNNSITGASDELSLRTPKTDTVKGTIIENTNYLVFKPSAKIEEMFNVDTIPIKKQLLPGFRTEEAGNLYFPEINYDSIGTKRKLHYSDGKIGLQALSLPLKFRGEIKATDKIPRIAPQVETGITLGFALGFKKNYNTYSPTKNFWGKNVTTISLTAGPMLGASAIDLKSASTAPGLVGDRKSVSLSYGVYMMIGIGTINFGYAVGIDSVLGHGASSWVYGGKIWHGLIVALNVITF
jgi:hypothetical protein